MQAYTREAMAARDRSDPLRAFRDQFVIPDGLVYLDGNSLGMLPRICAERAAQVVEQEWGRGLIGSQLCRSCEHCGWPWPVDKRERFTIESGRA